MDLAFFITAFITLFVVIDPVGLAPIFVALTAGETGRRRRAIALRACGIAAAILVMFAVFGEAVLDVIGVSLPAFRIAGGILLFITALDMLFERRTKRREDKLEEDRPDPSVFPLAIPLIAGPGAIATVILLTSGGDWQVLIGVQLVMVAVIAVVLLFFFAAPLLERALGRTGIDVVTRLLGMLLAALSVQFVLDGIGAFPFAN